MVGRAGLGSFNSPDFASLRLEPFASPLMRFGSGSNPALLEQKSAHRNDERFL